MNGAMPSTHLVAASAAVHTTPEMLQTPVFLVQFESTVQLAPALAALASQVPGLVVQFEFFVQAAPALPEVALQVPPSVHWLLAVQVLVGWLLQ